MTTPTRSQLGRMAAHLCDLAGIAARNDEVELAARIARAAAHVGAWGESPMGHSDIPAESHYRVALRFARLASEDINASVASCMREEHSADSIMGRIARMRDDAERSITYEDIMSDAANEAKRDALNKILDTLEGEGRNARTGGGT